MQDPTAETGAEGAVELWGDLGKLTLKDPHSGPSAHTQPKAQAFLPCRLLGEI